MTFEEWFIEFNKQVWPTQPKEFAEIVFNAAQQEQREFLKEALEVLELCYGAGVENDKIRTAFVIKLTAYLEDI